MCPLPTKEDRERLSQSSSSIATTGTVFAAFPELLAFLSKTSLEGGTSRRPGKLSLQLVSGSWQASLNDDETGLYACLTGACLDDLLLTVEDKLQKSLMPWRVSMYARKGKGKG